MYSEHFVIHVFIHLYHVSLIDPVTLLKPQSTHNASVIMILYATSAEQQKYHT